MKRAATSTIEALVRDHDWAAPPPGLRARVLSEAIVAAPPMVRSDRVWFSRTLRMGLVVLVLAALPLGVGACTAFDLWAGHQLDAQIARIAVKYGSLDEQASTLPPVPSDDNRARVVRAAAALVVPLDSSRHRAIGLRVPSPVAADLRAFADMNRAAVRLAREIGHRRQSNWDVEYATEGERPPWTEIRTLSDALHVSALLDLEAGRGDEAASAVVSGLAVAASIRQEPDLLAQLIRISITSRHISALHQLVTQSEPSKAALEELARWLAESRTPDPMRVALPGELRHVHAVFERMERGSVDPDIGQYIYPETWPSVPASWYGPLARIGRPIVRQAHARYLREIDQLIDAQADAPPRPALREAATPPRWALADRLAEKFLGGIASSVKTGDDFNRELSVAELAVALRRYRLDRGAYPDDLSALAPAYVTSLPIDPYTGQPPVYARKGAGFTLRAESAGPDIAAAWTLEWTVVK